MRTHSFRSGLLLLFCLTILTSALSASELINPAVATILQEQCLKCHGEKKTSGRLDLRTLESMLQGGKRGPALIPGNVGESRLLQLVRPDAKPHMPPGNKQLSVDQIAQLETWVAALPPNKAHVVSDKPQSEASPKASQATGDPAEIETSPFVLPPGVDPTLAIDLFVGSRWRDKAVAVAERCDDTTFARRVYLDLTGRIPTVEQLNGFCADTNSDKRRQLVDRLIASELYASHLADVFDVVLLGRRGDQSLQERQQHGWRDYLENSFATNRPWDRMAREMVLARASDDTDVRAGWFLYERKNNYQEIAEAVSPNLFGIRIECAQCHDHPLAAEIEQRHYWGLVAFFNRGKNQNTKAGPRVVESAVGGFQKFTDLGGDAFDASLTYFASATIEEAQPEEGAEEKDSDDNYRGAEAESRLDEPRVPRFSRRQLFADEILSAHPLVAKAFVNRIWAMLIGRGIVHPVDRMDSTNPPSHPELLEWLSEDFRQHGFDVKRLIRSIVNSRCYQLNSIPPSAQALPADFTYGLAKPLTAESYLNSIYLALTDQACTNQSLMNQFRSDFPHVFPEEWTATLTQALLMTNNPAMNGLFASEQARTIDALQEMTDAKTQVEFAFWKLFGRQPDAEEMMAATGYLEQRNGTPAAIRQLLWAMIGSAEFRINH